MSHDFDDSYCSIKVNQDKQDQLIREIERCDTLEKKFQVAKRAVDTSEIMAETAQEHFTNIRRSMQRDEHIYDDALLGRTSADEKEQLMKQFHASKQAYFYAEKVKDHSFKIFTRFLEIERNIMIEMGEIKM
jgi:hypothetical protein